MQQPASHQTVMPYLILPDAWAFLDFTSTVFHAELLSKHMHDDGSIMHAEVRIGDATIMIGQSSEQFPPQPAGLFIYVKDADASYARALKEGATSLMPLEDKEYGRTCGIVDTNNNTWWITSIEHL
jgi:PhnB protein